MPSAAFTAWLADVATTRHVLCELQPAEWIKEWTAVGGGTPNTYSASWPSLIQASVVAGGVWRRLDGVRQNDIDLTEQASIAAVDANLGSWFLDTSSDTLYISTTTGSNPETFAFIGAFLSLFFATAPVDFVGGELYEPRLTGIVPEISGQVEDPLFGVKVFPEGEVELSNADGFFDGLLRAYVWKDKLARFYLGGGDLAFADYEQVVTMRIEDAGASDAVCRFKLRAMASILETFLPVATITSSDFPRLGEGVEGRYKPLLYGQVTGINPPLVDTAAGAEVYLVADADEQVLTAVSQVQAINKTTGAVVVLATPADYTVDLAACTVTVTNATYTHTDYEIRVNATGESDGAGGSLSTFGDIVEDMLLVIGERASRIDSSSFDAADTDAPYALGLWITEGRPAAEYVRLLERSVLASVYTGLDGRWAAEVWDPTYDPATVETLEDADIAGWRPDDKIENLMWDVRVNYDRTPATGAWKVARTTDLGVKHANETGASSVTLHTALVSSSDATVIVQRYALIASQPSLEVDIEPRGVAPFCYRLFQKIAVTRARAPVAGGSLSGHVFEVLSFRKQLAPPRAPFRIGDLRGFGERVGRWTASSAPAWSAATDADKAVSGFWADSSGLIDPADAATKDQSVWW